MHVRHCNKWRAWSLCVALTGAGLSAHSFAYESKGYSDSIKPLNVLALPDSVRIEWEDRINRIKRLSAQFGAPLPSIEDTLQLGSGQIEGVNFEVPIVRIVYRESSLFDFDIDEIRPDAAPILNVIAETIRRDLPDTQLLVVGHTDSKGTDAYNDDLATRRAANVMRELVRRGVSVMQLSTAAMGERQPIASNSTDEGRARNRRVEFMISALYEANVRLVEEREINALWLNDHEARAPQEVLPAQGQTVPVFRPQSDIVERSVGGEVRSLRQVGIIRLRPPRIINLRSFE